MLDILDGEFGVMGFPYHGLVRNNVLTLPNGVDIPVTSSRMIGPTFVYRIPGAPGDTRSAAEKLEDKTVNGREYYDYLLMPASGSIVGSSTVYGVTSGFLGKNTPHIYVDPAGTPWFMYLYIHDQATSIGLTLVNRFGVLSDEAQTPDVDIDLGTLSGGVDTSDDINNGWTYTRGYHSYNYDGSIIKINRYPVLDTWPGVINRFFRDYYGYRVCSHIYTITISGVGSLDPATLGQGISANLSVEALSISETLNSTTVSGTLTGGRCSSSDPCYTTGDPPQGNAWSGDDMCFADYSGDAGTRQTQNTTEVIGEWFEGNTLIRGTVTTNVDTVSKIEWSSPDCFNSISQTWSGDNGIVTYTTDSHTTKTVSAGAASASYTKSVDNVVTSGHADHSASMSYVSGGKGVWLEDINPPTVASLHSAAVDAALVDNIPPYIAPYIAGMNVFSSTGVTTYCMGLSASIPYPDGNVGMGADPNVATEPVKGLITIGYYDAIAYI